MDREERDKLDRLGAEAMMSARLPDSDVDFATHMTRAVLDAVLPAYDAMRDAEQGETVGYVSPVGALAPIGRYKEPERYGWLPVVRRVGKEGGS